MQNPIPLKTGSGEFNSIYFFLICNLSRVAMVLIQTLMLQEHALRWQWGDVALVLFLFPPPPC